MAKLNLPDETVWDNAATPKWSTLRAGMARILKFPVLGVGGGLKGLQNGSMPIKIVSGTFDFDASYPTGGEDISGIWDLFPKGVVDGVLFDMPNVAAARTVKVDTVNKKLLAYTDGLVTQVAGATNLSAVTGLRWFAWGM